MSRYVLLTSSSQECDIEPYEYDIEGQGGCHFMMVRMSVRDSVCKLKGEITNIASNMSV